MARIKAIWQFGNYANLKGKDRRRREGIGKKTGRGRDWGCKETGGEEREREWKEIGGEGWEYKKEEKGGSIRRRRRVGV